VAHYAKVSNGTVIGVYRVENAVIDDGNGGEDEALGQAFLAGLLGGDPSDYVQTSYAGATRGGYAGPGYRWDGKAFTPPEPVITTTAKELADAGLDAAAIDALSKS
jgi:hypothetical protein